MHHSVVLARIAHVEEDNGADERCKETNQQEVAHRVRKIIWEGDCRRLQQDKIQPRPNVSMHNREWNSSHKARRPDSMPLCCHTPPCAAGIFRNDTGQCEAHSQEVNSVSNSRKSSTMVHIHANWTPSRFCFFCSSSVLTAAAASAIFLGKSEVFYLGSSFFLRKKGTTAVLSVTDDGHGWVLYLMAEWSKAAALGAALFGGVGSKPIFVKLYSLYRFIINFQKVQNFRLTGSSGN